MPGKLFSSCVLLFLVPVAIHALETLDIRDYEASDECHPDLAQVRVMVNRVGEGGILTVELYNDPENFLNKNGRVRRIRVPAMQGSQQVCFTLDKHGTYAVAAYHDVDGNRKLKKHWNMMPKEPFGLSNNPKLKFGFPKFEPSAFQAGDTGADISINLLLP